LARRQNVARLELGSLAERDVATILEHAGRRPSLAARVWTATRGNPFFIGEVIAAAGADGEPASALTSRARDVVRRRLAHLPDGTADVLAAAAVAGAEFDADVPAAATGVDVGRALDAFEAAERARLVRPAGAIDRFSFAHALVRQAILDDLPAGRRVRLHARIAHALADSAPVKAVPVGDLAAHFAAAGTLVDAAQAVGYARAAGEEANARLAFDIAAVQYERAARAHELLPDRRDEERLDLELARGRALSLAGDGRADEVLRGVAAAAEAAGDGARMADALLALRMEYADFVEEDAEMVALLRRALALLSPGDSAIRARLEGFLAQEAFSSVPDRDRREMVGRALTMARRVGDPAALASVLTSHSWIVAGPDSLAQRIAVADELVAVARAASLPYAECDGQQFRFLALIESGDIEGADAARAAAHAAVRAPKSRWTVAYLDSVQALVAGDLVEAEAAAVRAREAAREINAAEPVAESAFVRLLGCVRLVQGRLGEHAPARRAMSEYMTRLPPTFLVVSAHAAREQGDRDAARDAFRSAVESGLLAMPRGPTWATTMAWAADICAWLGDRETAAALLEQLTPFADVMTWQYGPIGRGVGLLELALGRAGEAERHLRAAVALCERTQARAFLAMAQHDLGAQLLPSQEGRALVESARVAAEQLGLLGLTARTPAPSSSSRG
jgi:hypothetical protein